MNNVNFSNDHFEYEYTDQPIQRRGVFRNASGNIPQRILKMEALYDPGLSTSEDKRRNFYVQAKYMEDYECDCSQQRTFQRWFPTYHDMREDQLMSYFGWRTRIRHDVYEKTEDAYAYVYIYELLNQIGFSSPYEGFRLLQEFYERYAKEYQCLEMQMNLDTWMKQYCICFGLDDEITWKLYAKEIEQDQALDALCREDADAESIYNAFCLLSSYKPSSSIMVKKNPEEYKELLRRIWQRLNALEWMKSGGNLFEYCFGRKDRFVIRFFSNAVFFDRDAEERRYTVDAQRVFTYEKGKWYCECFRMSDPKLTELGNILREADRQMREAFQTGHAIRQREVDGRAIMTIAKVIEEYQKEKLEASRPKIVIDMGRLSGIRADAAETREKLLTEEERAEEKSEVEVKEEKPVKKEYPFGLTEAEAVFLQMLAEEQDWQSYLREKHLMASVVSENINEKMFDEFGDTVLMFEDDLPCIVEDYLEDITCVWEE